MKEDYDGAVPSANSVAALGLLRLGKITDQQEYIDMAEKTLLLFSDNLANTPRAVPYLLQALDFLVHEPRRAVITGDPNSAGARDLIAAAHGVYQPNKVILGVAGQWRNSPRSCRSKKHRLFISAPAPPVRSRPATRLNYAK